MKVRWNKQNTFLLQEVDLFPPLVFYAIISLYRERKVVVIQLNQFVLSVGISPMNMMWISFYSIGFMIFSMFLIYISRQKISNGIVSGLLAFIAYVFLIIGFLTMIFVIFTW